jgi:hypothetical protein
LDFSERPVLLVVNDTADASHIGGVRWGRPQQHCHEHKVNSIE